MLQNKYLEWHRLGASPLNYWWPEKYILSNTIMEKGEIQLNWPVNRPKTKQPSNDYVFNARVENA